jgi:transposase InsO family protein
MHRILAQNGELKERRNQLRHPQYKKPELLATGPNQVWTWDITKLLGPAKWSSRPVESHHQPLTKPCLRLSPHTAFHGDRDASSQKQPLSVVVRRFLLVAQLTKTTHLAMSSSWLPAHYRRFNATPGRSAIFNCIDISPSWFSLIGFLLASVEDFPCFGPEPESDSRHLYTGHRMVSKQVSSMLILGHRSGPSFDVI